MLLLFSDGSCRFGNAAAGFLSAVVHGHDESVLADVYRSAFRYVAPSVRRSFYAVSG